MPFANLANLLSDEDFWGGVAEGAGEQMLLQEERKDKDIRELRNFGMTSCDCFPKLQYITGVMDSMRAQPIPGLGLSGSIVKLPSFRRRQESTSRVDPTFFWTPAYFWTLAYEGVTVKTCHILPPEIATLTKN